MAMNSALTLSDLKAWLAARSIDQAYEDFNFDYASIGKAEEAHFVSRFQWRLPPSAEVLRRLFNQVNSSFAERASQGRPDLGVGDLLAANALFLFREAKPLGLRTRDIAFGVRKHLDRFHPMRAVKWLAGADPSALPNLIDAWSAVARARDFTVERALVMTMLLVALHPFADANGRMARLAFSALLQRSNADPLWLNEATDGELLRTGSGVQSTEYLMAMLMIEFANGTNVINEDGRADTGRVAELLGLRIAELARGDWGLLNTEAFSQLYAHLKADQHIVEQSPRFECLRDALVD